MKGYWSLVAALPLALVIGCGSDVGDGPNPAPTSDDEKAPTTDLAQVSGAGNSALISHGEVGLGGSGVVGNGSVGSYGVGGGGGTSHTPRRPVAE